MTAAAALPPNIASYVQEYVSRARARALWRAAGLAVSALLAWGLACCLADRLLQLSEWVRAGLLAAGLATTAVILYRPLRARLARRLDWLQAAAEVERHNPRFGQRLLTVTARVLGPAEHRGSDDLLYRLMSDVDREAAARAPAPPLARRAAALPWVAAICLVAAGVALARVETLGLSRLAVRLAAPFADVDPVTTTSIRVTPGDTRLVQSTPLHVEAVVDRLPPGIEADLAARQPLRMAITQNTVELTLREDGGGILPVVSAIASRGRVLRLEVGGASLEDVFVELTKNQPSTTEDASSAPRGVS